MDFRLKQLEQYTYLEFSVSPQTFEEYLILLVQGSQKQKIDFIIQTYYEHLEGFIFRGDNQYFQSYEETKKNKKIRSLIQLVSIGLQQIQLTAKKLSHLIRDFKIQQYLLEYMLENSLADLSKLHTLKFAIQIKQRLQFDEINNGDKTKLDIKMLLAINIENSNEKFNDNSKSLQGTFHQSIHAETLYLLVQLLFLQEEYDQVRQIIDTFQLCSIKQDQFDINLFYFDAEKLNIVRQLVDENIMSPVTQISEDEQQTKFQNLIRLVRKENNNFTRRTRGTRKKIKSNKNNVKILLKIKDLINTDQSILQMSVEKLQTISSQPNMIVDYLNYLLDDSVRFFNKDSFNVFKMSLQYAHKSPDYYMFDYIGKLNVDPSMDPRQALSIFEQIMPTQIDVLLQPHSFKIMVILLIERSEQFRVRIEKDKLNIDLFNFTYVQQKILTEAIKINNLISFDLTILINHCLNKKTQIGCQKDLQVWVTNLQIVLFVLFGQLHLTYQNIVKNKGVECKDQLMSAKIILRCLNQVFDVLQEEDMLDVVRDFIDSTCTRYYLDTIQAVFMKEENYSDPIIFNSIHSFLNQYFIDFELNCKLKSYFLKLAFKREKQLISITIRSFHLPIDQIEIKYSKLYKKQIPFYYKQKKYLKSISQTLKYFLGYQSPVSIHKRVFLAEQQIIVLLFKNFLELKDNIKDHNNQMASLIISQFIDDRILTESYISDLFQKEPFEFLQNETEYLVDATLISKMGKFLKVNNASNEKLSYMINRMRDGDSFLCHDESLKQNIKEKYLKKYLNFLRDKINQ